MARGHEGRVALITGAASGIGQACARRLAEDGVDIVIADVKPALDTVKLVEAAGRSALAVECDITNPEQVTQLASQVAARFGRCDIVFNNAGMYSTLKFDEITYEIWRRYMALNLDAAFLLAKAFLPGMQERRWGRIVNMASNSFYLLVPGLAHYIASKGGVVGLTRALASEYGEYGITVNALAPGPTLTEKIAETFFTQAQTRDRAALEAFMSSLAQNQAIKRVSMPEDLVGALSFLTSDDAAFMTGQTLVVDGGWARH